MAVEGRAFLPVVFVIGVAAVRYAAYYRTRRRIRRLRPTRRGRHIAHCGVSGMTAYVVGFLVGGVVLLVIPAVRF